MHHPFWYPTTSYSINNFSSEQSISFDLLYQVSHRMTLFRVGMQTMANLVLTRHPCNVCGLNLGFYMCQVRATLTTPKRKPRHHMAVGFICYECMQEPLDDRHKRWWQEVFHNHVVLADPMIQNLVSQYLWSSIHRKHPCSCGNCDPSWRWRGWICWG